MSKKEYEYDLAFLTSLLSQICDYAKINGYDLNQTVSRIGTQITATCDFVKLGEWYKGEGKQTKED